MKKILASVVRITGALAVILGAGWLIVAQPVLPVPHREPPEVDPARLKADVLAISGEFYPRNWEHPENLNRAAAYIGKRFREAGGEVSEQPFRLFNKEYRNVIARFGPSDGPLVIVGAHYDAEESTPGADDNASGVAGLIALAGLLGRAKLSAPVELVAYTLEEPPFFGTDEMGSAVHARSVKARGLVVSKMIALECIGYFRDELWTQDYPMRLLSLYYPVRGNFIAVVGRFGQSGAARDIKRKMQSVSALPVYSINAPAALPGIDFSDHRNYWAEGYPAVMITDTAFFRNSTYHKPGDTPDTLDYRRMAMVVEGVYAAVVE